VKVGLQINRFDWPGGPSKIGHHVRTIAVAADEAGFDSEWVMDHFLQIHQLGPETDPMLEAYTTLGFMAGITKRVMLGTMVTGVVYRSPALLVKAVTALDVLSGGRAYLGIGAGWNEDEAVALGLGRPLAGGRFEKLEETLKIAKQMWLGDTTPFQGKQYQLERPISSPQTVQKPHPKILVGGGGEQKTLRFVAQYADACNFFGGPELEHKMDVLRRHCEDVGRNFDEIEVTSLARVDIAEAAKDPGALLKNAETLAKLGVSHIILRNGPDPNPTHFEVLAKQAVPELHRL
jgi:F420-dependent oxidoreductase-like protein